MSAFRFLPLVTTSVMTLALAACGGGDGGSAGAPGETTQINQAAGETPLETTSEKTLPPTQTNQRPLPASQAALQPASCDAGSNLVGGRHYRVEMPSRVDGAAIVFEVYEPTLFDCAAKHPLILQGHGFGGSRETEASTRTEALQDAGYTVISIDQRGHGESGGTIRVMDPDYAGEDLVQIVDWAEAQLDYLAYRQNNLLLGAIGGSYGGGYQYLLYNVDPDQRMDAMVPEITWHDLTDSLNPGNTVKTLWGVALAALGDAETGFSMDPILRSTLVEAAATNHFPEAALDFFYYHSPSYFCDNERGLNLLDSGDTADYTLDPVLGLTPLTADGHYIVKTPTREPYPVDVLMFQGTRDSLFNFNEAYENYQCMKKAGGDVRLLTYPYGHHYLAPTVGLAQEALANPETYIEIASQGGSTESLKRCGDIEVGRATLAWFNEKLRGIGDADNVITTGQQICYSLTPGDAVAAPAVTVGGMQAPIQLADGVPATVMTGPNPIPAIVPLLDVPYDAVIAGIPTADITLTRGSELLDSACLEESDPLLGIATCDAIAFVGIGIVRADNPTPELIDDQVLPVRGLGQHQVDLVGVAERLHAGDRLVLMLYGEYPTFFASSSRDASSYLVQVKGSVQLPLLSADGQRQIMSF